MKDNFLGGVIIGLLMVTFQQDFMGKEKYIDYLNNSWTVTPTWIWIFIAIIVIYRIIENRRHNKEYEELLFNGRYDVPHLNRISFPNNPEDGDFFTTVNDITFKYSQLKDHWFYIKDPMHSNETVEENKVPAFINEIIDISKRRGLMISHEDYQGSFQITEYDETQIYRLQNADNCTK